MQPTLDIRRHGDGSIDFDFHRRAAMRRRRIARRMIVKRWLAAGGRLAGASGSAIANLLSIPYRRRSKLLVRATAPAAVPIVVVAFHAWPSGRP